MGTNAPERHEEPADEPPGTGVFIQPSIGGPASVQVGDNNSQFNNFIHGDDDGTVDVETLAGEALELRPGDVLTVPVLITNRNPGAIQLSLDVTGALAAVSRMEPASVRVPGRSEAARAEAIRCELRLSCGPSEPEMGNYWFQVEARAGGAGGIRTWRSKQRSVTIVAVPAVQLRLAEAVVRAGRSRVFSAEAVVANIGNTPFSGQLMPFDDAGLAELPVARRRSELVRPSWLAGEDRFRLTPARSISLPLSITVPSSLRRRDWQLPLRAVATTGGTGGVISSGPGVLSFSDPGLVADVVAGGRELMVSSARRLGPPARDWARQPSRIARGAVLAGLLVGVLAAGLAGFKLGSGEDERSAAAEQSAAPLLGSEASVAAPSPSVSPGVESSSAVAASTSPTSSVFSPMPCEPGTWTVFLAAVNGPDVQSETEALVRHERIRAKHFAPALAPRIRASAWDESCPSYRGSAEPGDELKRYWFIWIAPVPTEAKAHRLCTELAKPMEWDCLVKQVAE